MGGRGGGNNAPAGGAAADAAEGPGLAGPEAEVAGNPTPKLLTFVLDGNAVIPDTGDVR